MKKKVFWWSVGVGSGLVVLLGAYAQKQYPALYVVMFGFKPEVSKGTSHA